MLDVRGEPYVACMGVADGILLYTHETLDTELLYAPLGGTDE